MGKKAKPTEKQTEILNNHTEKAKQVFKWLFSLFNTKLYYDEEYDGWFFSNEAKTVQDGDNKKLAKHSKHTLTKIK